MCFHYLETIFVAITSTNSYFFFGFAFTLKIDSSDPPSTRLGCIHAVMSLFLLLAIAILAFTSSSTATTSLHHLLRWQTPSFFPHLFLSLFLPLSRLLLRNFLFASTIPTSLPLSIDLGVPRQPLFPSFFILLPFLNNSSDLHRFLSLP